MAIFLYFYVFPKIEPEIMNSQKNHYCRVLHVKNNTAGYGIYCRGVRARLHQNLLVAFGASLVLQPQNIGDCHANVLQKNYNTT